jgi:quercetin dioxygenase-like cupin family protein
MKLLDKKKFIAGGILVVAIIAIVVGNQMSGVITKTPNPNIERSNLINGQVPPNTPTKTMFESRILTEPQTDAKGNDTGMVLVTSRSVRDKGTRSPIHVHPFGGQTCVVSGEMSLYLDGEPDIKTAGPGDCYYMPPGRRMTGVNSADTRTIMIDTFVVPAGEQVWIVVEPGMEDAQNQFDKMFDTGEHKH